MKAIKLLLIFAATHLFSSCVTYYNAAGTISATALSDNNTKHVSGLTVQNEEMAVSYNIKESKALIRNAKDGIE